MGETESEQPEGTINQRGDMEDAGMSRDSKGGSVVDKEKKAQEENAQETRAEYSKPRIKKHENLKEITLLSFTPPGK